MESGVEALADALHAWLDREEAELDLTLYFAEPFHRAGGPVFSGRFFERFDGGGDRPEVCDRFTAADLVAVQLLSVSVPPETSIAILHGDLARALSQYLRAIPTDVRIGDTRALEQLRAGGPADEAWTLLDRQVGVGYVTAGKLLARKRPHLIPVYDSVVRCAVNQPQNWWRALHEVLAEPRTGILERLNGLRSACRLPAEVSELRVLDVVIWMGHRSHHGRDRCSAPGIGALRQ